MAISTDDSVGLIRPILDTEWLAEPGRRSPAWIEVLVIVWLVWLYDEISNLSPLRLHAALAHARSLLHFENVWHLNPELGINTWAAAHRALALPMADFYDSAHFVLTLSVVAVLWWRRPDLYRPLRNTLVLVNVIGFIVFWAYPLAPPRLLPAAGFVDVVAVTHAWGSWQTSAMASQANELAAMPSLHMAWACWTAVALWRMVSRRHWRALIVAYPFVTAVIVMATGNHFLLDVVAGALTFLVAGALASMAKTWRMSRSLTLTWPPPRARILPPRVRRWLRV